jgi:RNA polymerase subunit RPABC4/transcription elongation factor Spt4
MNCNTCGVENNESSKFCSACGNDLLHKVCSKCGLVFINGAQFCNQCGTKQISETTEDKLDLNLIKCETCKKDISSLADKCLHCGAPVNWVHPKIKQLLIAINQLTLPEKAQYWSNKTDIWGETQENELSIGSWISLAILVLFVLATGGLSGFLVAPIAYYYYVLKPKRKIKKSFRANLLMGTWESSDDAFWKPVRDCIVPIGNGET